MFIRIGYDLTIDCPQETPVILMLDLRDERRCDLRSPETTAVWPPVAHSTYHDLFGNTCRRLVAPAGSLRLVGDAIVADSGLPEEHGTHAGETPVSQLPDEALTFLLGSRYCETDQLSVFAWQRFGSLAPGWGRVQAVLDYVNGHIKFNYGAARATRTAYEAWQEQTGVCRDFAHLTIALLRSLNIPARYVNGYLGDIGVPYGGPMDFSAWVEVYVGGRWFTVDARHNTPRIGRVVIARGRDAADVAMVHTFGPHQLVHFSVVCEEVGDLPQAVAGRA